MIITHTVQHPSPCTNKDVNCIDANDGTDNTCFANSNEQFSENSDLNENVDLDKSNDLSEIARGLFVSFLIDTVALYIPRDVNILTSLLAFDQNESSPLHSSSEQNQHNDQIYTIGDFNNTMTFEIYHRVLKTLSESKTNDLHNIFIDVLNNIDKDLIPSYDYYFGKNKSSDVLCNETWDVPGIEHEAICEPDCIPDCDIESDFGYRSEFCSVNEFVTDNIYIDNNNNNKNRVHHIRTLIRALMIAFIKFSIILDPRSKTLGESMLDRHVWGMETLNTVQHDVDSFVNRIDAMYNNYIDQEPKNLNINWLFDFELMCTDRLCSEDRIVSSDQNGQKKIVLTDILSANIKEYINTTNSIGMIINICDQMFSQYGDTYTEVKTHIVDRLEDVVVLTLLDVHLAGDSKKRSRFLQFDVVVTGVIGTLNQSYRGVIQEGLDRLENILSFYELSSEVAYPPVVFTKTDVDKLNNLFNQTKYENVSYDQFKSALDSILRSLHYPYELIMRGFEYASNKTDENCQVDIVHELYHWCRTHQNTLIIKPDYTISNTFTNPSAKRFLQVQPQGEFSYSMSKLETSTGKRQPARYVKNFHTTLNCIKTCPKQAFVDHALRLYESNVTHPVDPELYKMYLHAYHDIANNVIKPG